MPDDRCRVYGHEHYRLPCKGCRIDALAVDDTPTPLTWSPDQAVTNTRGASAVRAELDGRARAAGERTEEDR